MVRSTDIRLLDDTCPPQTPGRPDCVRLKASLPVFGETLALDVEVPDCRIRLAQIVPLARSICDRVVAASVSNAEAQGQTVSCRKGCSACCAYLLAVSEPEAFCLIEDIQRLSAARRNRILQGFVEMGRLAEQSGVREVVHNRVAATKDVHQRTRILSEWWSKLKQPCPILQGDACSMYPRRPMVCREFLVVSDSSLCGVKSAKVVEIPFAMEIATGALSRELEGTGPQVDLVLFPRLLKWFGDKQVRSKRTWRGPMMVERFLGILSEMAQRAEAAA